MSLLQQRVSETLSSHGALARSVPGFQPREGQTDMAMAVTQTLEQGGQLVVEAGTGVGKTYAYLVPVLLSGQRALVSTATKALQDQLFSRDIPRLVEVLGLPIRVALLKGRGNYLCLHRMAQARHSTESAQPGAQRALASLRERLAQRKRRIGNIQLCRMGQPKRAHAHRGRAIARQGRCLRPDPVDPVKA